MSVYAVIHTGGKQYRVSPGDSITVEKLTAQPGEQVDIDQVYLLAHGGQVVVGDPVVKNARVKAQVLGQKRGKKLIIFKHRRRKGYRNTTGHRQNVTELRIIEIIHEGASYTEPLKRADPGNAKATAPARLSPDKQQTAAKQNPERKPVSAAKAAAAAIRAEPIAPQPAAKPIAAERSVAPEAAKKNPSEEAPATPKQEPKIPAAPPKEPARPVAAAAQKADEFPVGAEAAKMPAPGTSQDERKRRNIIGAVIIALALLGLLFFMRRERPAITSAPPPELSKPAPAEPVQPKPPVREVKTRETAPLDKPAAPAQPPD